MTVSDPMCRRLWLSGSGLSPEIQVNGRESRGGESPVVRPSPGCALLD